MPIYEYRCLACRHTFQHLTGVLAQEERPACPQCGGTELQRLLSRFATARAVDEDFGEDLDDLGNDLGGGDDEGWEDEDDGGEDEF